MSERRWPTGPKAARQPFVACARRQAQQLRPVSRTTRLGVTGDILGVDMMSGALH